jgi:hypothetical protein
MNQPQSDSPHQPADRDMELDESRHGGPARGTTGGSPGPASLAAAIRRRQAAAAAKESDGEHEEP